MIDPATFIINDADIPDLRNVISHITRSGYCEARVLERLGLQNITDLQWRALPIYREEQLAVRDVLASVIDLFLLQGTIPTIELDRLFKKSDQDILNRVGLLSIDGQGFARARASLFPVGKHLIFSDHAWQKLPHPGCAIVPYDQVMAVGADSRWLAHVTLRRPVENTLDLCTGSGIHAILAASHSRRVFAVDINPRAVLCARFNAQVSGMDNVTINEGNLYEPVQGERFDLITANPPFVPSPLNSLCFRDGGQSGEDVQRQIVAGLPSHLAPGGIAQIVTELGERDNESISDRLREWLYGAPMDILIHRLREHSAASYAIGHAQGDSDFGEFLDSVHDWSNNLKKQGYTRVVSVLLAFQWSDPALGPPWTRSEETQPPCRDAGIEIETLFIAERMACTPNLFEKIKSSQMRRAGQIGLLEARVLGGNISATVQAQVLGKALPVLQGLGPIEREILILMENPLILSELLALTRKIDFEKEDVLAAVRSLFRLGLINLVTDIRNSEPG